MFMRASLWSLAMLCPGLSGAQDLNAELAEEAREGRLEPPQGVVSADKWFSARVPAKVGEVRKDGESYLLTIDIGAEAPMVCEVTPRGFDFVDTLRRNLATSLPRVGAAEGSLRFRQLEATDAGVIGGVPFLETNWGYGTNDGGKTLRIGGLKQLVFQKFGHLVYCGHREVGYVKTFHAVTHSLAESFEAPAVEAAPYFVEIKTTSVTGSNIGVTVTSLQRNTDGGSQARVMSSIIVPSLEELQAHYAMQSMQLGPDDSLLSASHLILRDGKPVMKLELSRRDDQWMVSGERDGKPVNAALPAGSRPGNWVVQARALREILATEHPVGEEHSLPMWIAAQPTMLLDMRTRVIEQKNDNEYAAKLLLPRYESNLVLDKGTGLSSSAEISRGLEMVHIERVYLHGTF
jgi:hypothetical protein